MDENLQREQEADYQRYEVSGSHAEIGAKTAKMAQELIRPGEPLTKSQREYAEKCQKLVHLYFPEITEEFSGYAKELHLQEQDMLWHYTLGVEGGCSAIAVRTAEGLIVGRNYDYFYFENRRHLIYTTPTHGYAHVGMHEGLVGGRFDGKNEKGLFVSFNGAGEHPNPAVPGISFHLIVRYLLEKCADAKEAKEALLHLPVKEPKSYLVADPHQAFVAEIHPKHREIRDMNSGFIVVTNHFIHPNMVAFQPEWPNSVNRYERFASWGASADLSIDTLQKVM